MSRPIVDWRDAAARLVEEQRAKAMEAAARVWARVAARRFDFDFSDGIRGVAGILDGSIAPRSPAAMAALEVLRAFEIVK